LLISSPTGSGKTEAVFFPIIDIIMRRNLQGLRAIYVTPLRALNRDIFRRMATLCGNLGVKIKVRHGDSPSSERSNLLQSPPHILITTPETLDALCVIEGFNKYFKDLEFLIIDEVHELLEGRRGIHLLLTIERLKEFKNSFRIIGLSATIIEANTLAELLFGNKSYVIINESSERMANVVIRFSKNLNDFALKVEKILEEHNSAIIFANTRSMAEHLAYFLKEKQNLNIEAHHSSLGKEVREEVETKLKEGKLKAVVATSSLEYGLDIPFVDIVIQYGSPIQAKIFKQRVGRSQHKFGLNARGEIFVTDPIEALEAYVIANNSNNDILEKEKIVNTYDILIHHIIGLLLINGSISVYDLYSKIKNINLYKNLSNEELENILNNLSNSRLITIKNENIYPIRIKAIPYYFNTISTIFEEPLYSCIDIHSRKLIGKVDGRILFECYEDNVPLVLAGKAWKVVSINEEKNIAELLEVSSEAEIPIWIGELLPVSKEVAENVFELLKELIKFKQFTKLNQGYVTIDQELLKEIESFTKEIIINSPFIPSKDLLIVEKFENFFIIINPRGTKINRALATLLKGILRNKITETISTAYGVVMQIKEQITFDQLLRYVNMIPKIYNDRDFIANFLYDDYVFLSILKQVSVFTGVFKKESFKEITPKILRSLRNTFSEEEAIKWYFQYYLNIDELLDFVNNLSRDIKVLCFETRNPSPIASKLLSRFPIFKEIIDKPALSLVEAVEKRLLDEELLFICFACKYEIKKKVSELEENPRCFRCGSVKIAVVNPYDEGMMKVVEAFKRSRIKELKKLDNDFNRFILSSELMARFGKIAALVMAGRGIGPEFARRILINWNGNKNDLIKRIIEYEINYARTKKYWADNSSTH
jgi:ATP-dependent Lhr-like helicase